MPSQSMRMTPFESIQIVLEEELDEFKTGMLKRLAIALKDAKDIDVPFDEQPNVHLPIKTRVKALEIAAESKCAAEGNGRKVADDIAETKASLDALQASLPGAPRHHKEEATIIAVLPDQGGSAINPAARGMNSALQSLEQAIGKAGSAPGSWCLSSNTADHSFSEGQEKHGSDLEESVMYRFLDLVLNCVVALSILMMGIEFETTNNHPYSDTAGFYIVQVLCCVAFTIGVGFRMKLSSCASLFGRGSPWNVFDLMCVITMVIDVTVELFYRVNDSNLPENMAQARKMRALSFFHLLRIARGLRLLKLFRHRRDVQQLVNAVQYSFTALCGTLFLLAFITYFFALLFTQGTTQAVLEAGGNGAQLSVLVDRYGTMSGSYLTLFKAVSGGASWGDALKPLQDYMDWSYSFCFVVYIVLVVIGALNVITSIFVQSALAGAEWHNVKQKEEKKAQKEASVMQLKDVLANLDHDDTGNINSSDMADFLGDETAQRFLESVDIRPDDTDALFSFLDKRQGGSINIEDFCNGCLKLNGEVQNFDIHCLEYETHRLMNQCQQQMNYMEQSFLPKVVNTVRKTIEVGRHRSSDGNTLALADGYADGGPTIKVKGPHYSVNLVNCSGTLQGVLASVKEPPMSKAAAVTRVMPNTEEHNYAMKHGSQAWTAPKPQTGVTMGRPVSTEARKKSCSSEDTIKTESSGRSTKDRPPASPRGRSREVEPSTLVVGTPFGSDNNEDEPVASNSFAPESSKSWTDYKKIADDALTIGDYSPRSNSGSKGATRNPVRSRSLDSAASKSLSINACAEFINVP